MENLKSQKILNWYFRCSFSIWCETGSIGFLFWMWESDKVSTSSVGKQIWIGSISQCSRVWPRTALSTQPLLPHCQMKVCCCCCSVPQSQLTLCDPMDCSTARKVQVSSVQSLSDVRLFATPWTVAYQASLSFTNSRSLLKLIKSLMQSNHLIICHTLLLLPSIPPSIRVFSSESVLHIRWPKYWSFSFSISPSNEYSGLISFRLDWLDLLAAQGTLKSLQRHSSKASILQCWAFYIVQLSHPHMTTGKTVALTRWTFVGKVMSLLFSMLSWLIIAFLPRSKRLLVSWLQSSSTVILEPPKVKSLTVSFVSLSICHEVMGPDAMMLLFWMLRLKPTFSLSSFTFIKRLSSSLLSAVMVVLSAYLRLLIFLPAI